MFFWTHTCVTTIELNDLYDSWLFNIWWKWKLMKLTIRFLLRNILFTSFIKVINIPTKLSYSGIKKQYIISYTSTWKKTNN